MTTEPPQLPPVPPKSSAVPVVLIVVGAVVLVLLVIGALAAIAATSLMRMRHTAELVLATKNGSNLSVAMLEFQMEYGSFPDDETAKLVGPKSPYPYVLSGPHSNDYLRQLIAAGIFKSEDPFFVRGMFGREKPDNRMENGRALEPGEVGWGYVMDGNKAISSESYAAPLLVAPLMPDGPPGIFDARVFNGKILATYPDGSVKNLKIRLGGRLNLQNGKPLLETGPGTIWPAGVTPVIRPPAAP